MEEREKRSRLEYPRPELSREEWLNLNGGWEFCFDDNDVGVKEKWFAGKKLENKIIVPFCFQSMASGIGAGDEKHEVMWYATEFEIPKSFTDRHVRLNFGAVDYEAMVWVDGVYLGSHTGGYTPFSFDLTDALSDTPGHRLTVRVEDPYRCTQPRGKQNWTDKAFGCWYEPVSGIWQTVWLEPVSDYYIKWMKITTDIDQRKVDFEIYLNKPLDQGTLEVAAQYQDADYLDMTQQSEKRTVGEVMRACKNTSARSTCIKLTLDLTDQIGVDNILYWSPEYPNLYDVGITLKKGASDLDVVSSYFGMRKVDIKDGKFRLNNKPYYQKLILDQGYWKESLLTPPEDDAIRKDILLTKAMGFNGARKHQKIEDPRYYYWADRLGLLVWDEIPSALEFCTEEMENLYQTAKEVMERDINHPSIVCWVPLNESWGVRNICCDRVQQQFAAGLYYFMKSLDPTRIVSSNDGWEQVESDICSIHDYTAWTKELNPEYADISSVSSANGNRMLYADGYQYRGEPVLITEYGGIAFAKDSGDGRWGYNGSAGSEEEFLERYSDITRGFRSLPYVQGYCYTQLTDVFQEVNGLFDMDRNPKVPVEKIKQINK